MRTDDEAAALVAAVNPAAVAAFPKAEKVASGRTGRTSPPI